MNKPQQNEAYFVKITVVYLIFYSFRRKLAVLLNKNNSRFTRER